MSGNHPSNSSLNYGLLDRTIFYCSLQDPVSFFGVQFNLDPTTLPLGWSQCHNSIYAVSLNATLLPAVLSACNKAKLLLACRSVGNLPFTLAAMGLRADVLYNCSSQTVCTHVANGVGWYFSDTWSWGFVSGNDTVIRNSCDTASNNSAARLCWHTGQVWGGYRSDDWACDLSLELKGFSSRYEPTTWKKTNSA